MLLKSPLYNSLLTIILLIVCFKVNKSHKIILDEAVTACYSNK